MDCWKARAGLTPCEGVNVLLPIKPATQKGEHDCGAAALTMLFRFHRRRPPADLAALCCPQDGISPDTIRAVLLREWGHALSGRLTVGLLEGCVWDRKPVLCAITYPEWTTSHWVVVNGLTVKTVSFVCPLEGQRRVSLDEWAAVWRDVPAASPWQRWGVTSWPG